MHDSHSFSRLSSYLLLKALPPYIYISVPHNGDFLYIIRVERKKKKKRKKGKRCIVTINDGHAELANWRCLRTQYLDLIRPRWYAWIDRECPLDPSMMAMGYDPVFFLSQMHTYFGKSGWWRTDLIIIHPCIAYSRVIDTLHYKVLRGFFLFWHNFHYFGCNYYICI